MSAPVFCYPVFHNAASCYPFFSTNRCSAYTSVFSYHVNEKKNKTFTISSSNFLNITLHYLHSLCGHSSWSLLLPVILVSFTLRSFFRFFSYFRQHTVMSFHPYFLHSYRLNFCPYTTLIPPSIAIPFTVAVRNFMPLNLRFPRIWSLFWSTFCHFTASSRSFSYSHGISSSCSLHDRSNNTERSTFHRF